MSRTKRRTKGEPGWNCGRNPHEEKDWESMTLHCPDEVYISNPYKPTYITGRWYYSSRPIIKQLTPKEVAKKLARYHSDVGYGRNSKGRWAKTDNRGFRSHVKNELARYKQYAGEYEILLNFKKYNKFYWD